LRALIARDLQDASLPALSADRRFATAYNAVLHLAKMTIACAGYRVKGEGAHRTTFQALELSLGPGVAASASYFDRCRRKRNMVDYDAANVATETEAAELLRQGGLFLQQVEAWILQHHPHLAP
jgi:uncharacterized protein (UPF0332 family)